MRYCDFCGTRLASRRFHGFPTPKGGLSCGRSNTPKTVDGKFAPKVSLRCGREAGV